MKLIKCLGTVAIVLAICIVFSGGGYEKPVPIETPTEPEVPVIEQSKYIYYNVPLTDYQQEVIQAAAMENCVPYEIVLGVMHAESGFNPEAVGDSGNSLGIMQIQPRWHEWRLAETGGDDWFNTIDNAMVGIHILSEKLQKYGRVEKALVVYNMGDNGARGIESTAYSRKVLEYAYALQQEM